MCTWLSNWLFWNTGQTSLSKVQGLPKPLASRSSQRIALPLKLYFHRSTSLSKVQHRPWSNIVVQGQGLPNHWQAAPLKGLLFLPNYISTDQKWHFGDAVAMQWSQILKSYKYQPFWEGLQNCVGPQLKLWIDMTNQPTDRAIPGVGIELHQIISISIS